MIEAIFSIHTLSANLAEPSFCQHVIYRSPLDTALAKCTRPTRAPLYILQLKAICLLHLSFLFCFGFPFVCRMLHQHNHRQLVLTEIDDFGICLRDRRHRLARLMTNSLSRYLFGKEENVENVG